MSGQRFWFAPAHPRAARELSSRGDKHRNKNETVVTDFHKTGGQHMLQETAEEFHHFEGQDFSGVGCEAFGSE